MLIAEMIWIAGMVLLPSTITAATTKAQPRYYSADYYDSEPLYPVVHPVPSNYHHHTDGQYHPFGHHHHHYPCICLPYHSCKSGAISNSDGAGVLDPRTYPVFQQGQSKKCNDNYVCCPLSYLTSTTTTTTTTSTTTTTTKPPNYYWGCGIRNRGGIPDIRILNPYFLDDEALFGEFPWQAAILKRRGHWDVFVCGGTLIDPHYVATAAHCVKSYSADQIKVRLGEWDTKNVTVFYPRRDFHVHKIVIHPDFNPWNLQNDIAILRLDAYVPFTLHISPICLPSVDESFEGLRCVVTGWGKDDSGLWGRYQTILKKVDVPVISNENCQTQLRNTRLGSSFVLDPGFLCAGGEEDKDACKGDGGGPLACERNGVYKLAGIVSWGIGCGQRNVPGVYVRVSRYITWILSVVQEEQHYYDLQEHFLYPWG